MRRIWDSSQARRPADIIADLMLRCLVVPKVMACGGIVGLPPQAGLYTLLASLVLVIYHSHRSHISELRRVAAVPVAFDLPR